MITNKNIQSSQRKLVYRKYQLLNLPLLMKEFVFVYKHYICCGMCWFRSTELVIMIQPISLIWYYVISWFQSTASFDFNQLHELISINSISWFYWTVSVGLNHLNQLFWIIWIRWFDSTKTIAFKKCCVYKHSAYWNGCTLLRKYESYQPIWLKQFN